jgi:chromate reductase
MRVLAISGSLRQDSHNTRLLRAAADALPSGSQLELWHGLGELPFYNEEIDVQGEDEHPAVRELREAVRSADALLIATPEYNSSIPGVLKNGLDWASRPYAESVLRNKPAAVVGASTGSFGAVWAQAEVRKVLAASGSEVLDEEFPLGSADDAFAADGLLVDPDLTERLGEVIARLVALAENSALVVAA